MKEKRKLSTKEVIISIIAVAIVIAGPAIGITTLFWRANIKLWGYLASWGLALSIVYYLFAVMHLTSAIATKREQRGKRKWKGVFLTSFLLLGAILVCLGLCLSMIPWLLTFKKTQYNS